MRKIYEFLRLSTVLGDKYGVNISKPTVVILGSCSAGKSTLINGLLDNELSPVDIVPSTKGLIFFKYGESFLAEIYNGKFKTKKFKRQKEFIQFLTNRNEKKSFEQAKVFVNNPLLEKMTLVDTPGLDGPFIHSQSMERLIKQANKLVYIFHQRGIEEFNKRFLLQLADKYKTKNPPEISFWINCNLGNFDGTSLEETRLVLREIFLSKFQLHTINTRDPNNLKLFKYYLETDLATQVVDQVRSIILQKDRELGQSVAQTVAADYDAEFLLKFAQLKQTAEELISDRAKINLASQAGQHLNRILEINNKLNINIPFNVNTSSDSHKKTLNFSKIKKLLLELIDKIVRDPDQKLLDCQALAALAGKIKKESFLIVAAGGFSSGKSTFFNALMGEKILPAQSKPTTFAITHISYSTRKRAVVYFTPRVTLQLYDRINGKIEPRSDELRTLTKWLLNTPSEVTSYEIYENKHFRKTTREECLKVLQDLNQLVSRSPEDLSGPALYKIIPAKLITFIKLTEKVRLTLKSSEKITFDLSQKAGQESFYSTINSANAFRIERVEVYHPAEYLKIASFLDTPGLDSTHKYHSEITTDYLQNSDAYLIFLNARQLLLNQEKSNPVELISNRIRDYLKSDNKFYQKIFFILNFADTLTQVEREKVITFVKQHISITLPEPQIHIISSLSALFKKDDGSFQRLLNNLEKTVTNCRGKEILTHYLKEIRFILNTTADSINIKNIHAETPGVKLNLVKYSAAKQLLKNKVSLIKEINSRFSQLEDIICELRCERDFTGFIQGVSEQKKGLLFKTIKTVNCPSYFSWVSDLHEHINYSCIAIKNQVEKDVNQQLVQLPVKASLHINVTPPRALQISPVHKYISASVEQNRGLFGRIKERDVHRDLVKLIAEEQQELIKNINRWEKDVLKEISSKLGTIYAGLKPNLNKPSTSKKNTLTSKKVSPIIKEYLKELNTIETLLECPGGNRHGKCQNPR